MDGALPFYPKALFEQNASLKGRSEAADTWAQLWAKGFPTEVFSQDDVAAVDLWYRLHLHAYARRSKGAHVVYIGPGESVSMLPIAGTKLAPYGKTAIVLGPDVTHKVVTRSPLRRLRPSQLESAAGCDPLAQLTRAGPDREFPRAVFGAPISQR